VLAHRFADLAAGAIAAMEAAITARRVAAEAGRQALGELAAELQPLVPPEVN